MTATDTTWSTVVARVPAADTDVVSGLLWDAGVAGVEERSTADHAVVELRAGVPDSVATAVVEVLRDRAEVTVEPVADDGIDHWREYARPWRAGSRVVVVPGWQEAPDWVGGDDLVLEIDPGRAFGSGAHPTTRMCLGELERLVEPDVAVADVGCGSGVLAVAAARLGAGVVVAVDVEPAAVVATDDNVRRNGVADRVCASTTAAAELEAAAYDLVVANIGAATLVALAPALERAAAADATVVVSGVLGDQVDEVLGAFAAVGLDLAGTVVDDDWRTLVLRRS